MGGRKEGGGRTEYRVQITEFRVQSTDYRVRITEFRVQITEDRGRRGALKG
jgi:hypothetical protein